MGQPGTVLSNKVQENIEISVIVITPDDYGTIQSLIESLAAQTICEHIELVIVAPATSVSGFDTTIFNRFGAVRLEGVESIDSFAQATAVGIGAATAPIVALTEDHSFLDPKWAEILVAAHRGPWIGVGPAISNANPGSLVSWANIAIEYGEWLDPAVTGPVSHIPGHNSSYKRAALLEYGEDLGKWLQSESVLHWDLASKGHRLWLETSATTGHRNFSDFLSTIRLRFCCGRIFASSRARGWAASKRALYLCGSPLIPFVRLGRVIGQLRRPGRPRYLLPSILPLLLLFLVIDGMGETVGYAFGTGSAEEGMTRMEFHRERFVNRRERANGMQRKST